MRTQLRSFIRNYLTSSEIDLLLNLSLKTSNSVRNSCLIYMIFIHGFRVSEICQLRLSDIYLNSHQIFISRLKNGFPTTHSIIEKMSLVKKW